MWNLACPRGTWVRLAVRNFTSTDAGVAPKAKIEKFHFFGKYSLRAAEQANPLTDFYNGVLYAQLVPCITRSGNLSVFIFTQ